MLRTTVFALGPSLFRPVPSVFALGSAGGAVAPAAAGMDITAWQCGQRPFFPAHSAPTCSSVWHSWQMTTIVPSRCAGLLAPAGGIGMIAWQQGQRPLRPALAAWTCSSMPHSEQWTRIVSPWPTAFAEPLPAVRGMSITAWQAGQRPFFPAAASLTSSSAWHCEQMT